LVHELGVTCASIRRAEASQALSLAARAPCVRSSARMRSPVTALLFAALFACGSTPKPVVTPEEPVRDLGPEDIGPVPPEVRNAETDAYMVRVDGPDTAAVKQQVKATITVRAKPGLVISTIDEWKLEAGAPRDVDVLAPVLDRTAAALVKDTVTYIVTVVPHRAGVRHITFKLTGSVCDDEFCDVVGDLVSWNLEVR
jgi:hypothetical protein